MALGVLERVSRSDEQRGVRLRRLADRPSHSQFGLEIATDVFRGLLWVGDSYFEIDFQSSNQRKTLFATWKALSFRKENRNAKARQAFTKSLELNPRRVWAKQQSEKTPAQ